jgi:hypothetical protein
MLIDGNGCLRICENDLGNPNDFQNYIEYNYWVPFITQGTPDNPVNRIVFTTTGSVNLNPSPNPPLLSAAEADQVAEHFRGVNEYYKDAWLRIYLRLPSEYPFYSPQTHTFHVEEAAPFVSINGIEKGPDNHYGGWVIWNFGVDPLVQGNDRGPELKPNEQIAIWAHIAVKGELFQVVRVGYSLTVAGRVVPR